MKSQQYWALFLKTGSPEAYLLFTNQRRMEAVHVSDSSGAGASGIGL